MSAISGALFGLETDRRIRELNENKNGKMCPLLMQAWGRDPDRDSIACVGKDCALYVNAQREGVLGQVLTWEGCGLIHNIPWKWNGNKREKKPQ